jgi:DNA-binding IclR family transcriptional regulator
MSGKVSSECEVGAVRKALQILCEFNASMPRLGPSDVSRRLGIPKSTAHNLLRTLESLDFLRQDPTDRRYRLGPRVYELGLRFSQSTDLVSAAMRHLRRLAEGTKETVKLAVLSSDEILIMAAIESPYQLHTRGDEGVRAALHCTGLGKAVLSTLRTNEVLEIIKRRGLKKFTPNTITTPKRLLEELERIRADRYSLDMEENELGVVCVAAPIPVHVNGTVAALSVSAPSSRLNGERIQDYLRLVVPAARAVERELGSQRHTLVQKGTEKETG